MRKKTEPQADTLHIHVRTYPSFRRKLTALHAMYPSLRMDTSALLFAAEEGFRALGVKDPSPEMPDDPE